MNRHLVTLAAVAVAAILRWLLNPLLQENAPFGAFIVAVIFSAWYGGLRSAILATVLGLGLGFVLFVLPHSHASDPVVPFIARYLMYFLICLSITTFVEVSRIGQNRSQRTEQLARQQAETLRITFASIGDAVITTDVDEKIAYMNAVAEELTGWLLPDASGNSLAAVFTLISEQSRQRVQWPIESEQPRGGVIGLASNSVLISRDGLERVVDGNISTIRNDKGRFAGKIVIFRDVSARRRMEIEREEAQQQVIVTLESISDGFVRFDHDWKFAYVNAEGERLMGRKRDDLLGKDYWQEFPTVVGSKVESELRRAVKERVTIEFENFFEPWARWFSLKGCPTSDGGLTVFFHDITYRKKSEEALLRSEERMRLAVNATGLGVFDLLPQTQEQIWSERCKEIWGLPYDACVPPEVVLNAVHPDDRANVKKITEDSLDPNGSGGFIVEHRVMRPDNSVVWVLVQGKTVFDEASGSRKPIRSLGTMLDITARKQAEELLLQSEANLQQELADMTRLQVLITHLLVCPDLPSALEKVLDATITLLGADYGMIQIPNSKSNLLEIAAQRGINQEFIDRFPSVSMTDDLTSVRAFRERRRFVIEDVQSHLASERRCEIAASAGYRGAQFTPLLSHTNAPLGVLSTYHSKPHLPTERELRFLDLYARQAADYLERARNEKALRESEARYRAIGEAIDFGVWMCDPEGRNVYASDSFLRLIGITQEQCSDFGWTHVLHPDEAKGTIAAWRECVRTSGTWDREHRFKGGDGQWHNILTRGVPVRNDANQILGWVGINLDISRLKTAEEALREADRRKDEFLATLAHELRNPLAPIRNAIQVLRMNTPAESELTMAGNVIDRQTQQMTRLIDDLLDLSRISRNKLELRREYFELSTAIESAIETSQPSIEEFGHELAVDMSDESLVLNADLTRVAQIFMNLLNNAAKYTERGGRIELSVRRDGDEVVVSVKDNGIGIPTSKLPTLFQMFSQVEDSISRSQGGLGIGLSLVKSLVEMHGGAISAQSDGPGQGSIFVVRLPLCLDQQQELTVPEDSDESVPVSTQRILVVDDNLDAAQTLTLLLKMLGNDVYTVHDGEAAVLAAEQFQPDVILLDIGLPKMNGYDAARCIRKQALNKKLVLIAVTGWGQEDDKQRAKEAGFDKHLVKPVDPKLLLKLLADVKMRGRDYMQQAEVANL